MSVLDPAKAVCVAVGVGTVLWGGALVAGSSDAPLSDGRSPQSAESQAVKSYAFLHGQWFDGKGFQQTTWYSAQGRLTRTAPRRPASSRPWILRVRSSSLL